MTTFRSSSSRLVDVGNGSGGGSGSNRVEDAVLSDRAIGDIIRQANNLTADQVEQILNYQRERGVRFGEAAVALGLAKTEDVLWALSQQFHYPYAPDKSRLNPELVVATQPFSFQAEAFRAMRSNLIMRLYKADEARSALAIVSPDQGDGKTFFAANMAVAFSQLGGRTLLIDADMRNPRLHDLFGIENTGAGLSGILSGRTATNVISPVPALPSLFVLPVGTVPPNPLELVERPAFDLLIRELLGKFDYVIVDTPAGTLGTDGPVIAAKCGAALVVARENQSRLDALQDLLDMVNAGAPRVCGVVLNEF